VDSTAASILWLHNMELCGLSVSGAASGDILKQLPAGGWTTLRELELGKLSARELGFEPITRVKKPPSHLICRCARRLYDCQHPYKADSVFIRVGSNRTRGAVGSWRLTNRGYDRNVFGYCLLFAVSVRQ